MNITEAMLMSFHDYLRCRKENRECLHIATMIAQNRNAIRRALEKHIHEFNEHDRLQLYIGFGLAMPDSDRIEFFGERAGQEASSVCQKLIQRILSDSGSRDGANS